MPFERVAPAAPDVELRDRVIAAGLAAGLDSIGVCDAAPFVSTRVVLEERKAAGLNDSMEFTYRNPVRSTTPAATLDDASSLIVAARAYPGSVVAAPHGAHARVARYAVGDHYTALRAGLTEMARVLEGSGYRGRVIADDNALVDRAAAHRAGLGWYGKNANLLLPGRGSYFVLGSVITDASLPGTADVVEDGCGTCRRCLDGCPTGAIIAPGVVDAARCLSWLLQRPGSFPREHRAALGDRIYGCDECQEVCPPTRRHDQAVGIGPLRVDAEEGWIDILWLLTADDEALLERVGRWYIPRRELRHVRRNALVVLGNVGDGEDQATVAVLAAYLGDADELLVEHAAWAALRLGRADLLQQSAVSSHPTVRAELTAWSRETGRR